MIDNPQDRIATLEAKVQELDTLVNLVLRLLSCELHRLVDRLAWSLALNEFRVERLAGLAGVRDLDSGDVASRGAGDDDVRPECYLAGFDQDGDQGEPGQGPATADRAAPRSFGPPPPRGREQADRDTGARIQPNVPNQDTADSDPAI